MPGRLRHRPPSGDVRLLASISLGGAVGAAARYAVTSAAAGVHGDGTVVATLLVNLLGCTLIGVLAVLAAEVWPQVPLLRPALGTGVLGGFTTFSAYALDVEALARDGRLAVAVAYLVATPALALLGVWAGAHLSRRLVGRHRPPGNLGSP